MRKIIFVDTETRNEHGKVEAGEHRLWFGVALYSRFRDAKSNHQSSFDSLKFTTPYKFWNWTIKKLGKNDTIYILAHNWNFDGNILDSVRQLEHVGFENSLYINEGRPPVIIRFKREQQRIVLIDNLNYFRTSLAALGDSLGYPKREQPKTDDLSAWLSYAWHDVKILRLAFLTFRSFILENDLGTLQSTLASQAMTAYTHKFYEGNILIHSDRRALQLEREAYKGGRTDSFFRGRVNERVYKVDINSMYPAIMKNELFPYWKMSYHYPSEHALDYLQRHLDNNLAVVAKVDIETNEECFGVKAKLPQLGQRLIFPVGRFTTTLTTPELKYALHNGYIRKVYDSAIYKRTDLFSSFVDYFYSERQNFNRAGNLSFSYLCKILLNSLYGKFGQTGRKWIPSLEAFAKDAVYISDSEGNIKRVRTILNNKQELSTESESENSLPVIAAEVTGYARMYLWMLIKRAGQENVYYVDTDSLFVNRQGFDRLSPYIDETALGMLKLEGVSDDTTFQGPKHYSFSNKETIKGIKRNAKRLAEFQFEQDRFATWHTMIKNDKHGYIDITKIRKTLKADNNKRVIVGENQFTLPLRLDMF